MASKDSVPWPPRSPADVLLLTPTKPRAGSGEPASPSPLRRPSHPTPSALRRTPGALRLGTPGGGLGLGGEDDDDDDDDEELLRLKLARIEAKLKLKALQKKRKRADSAGDAFAAHRCDPSAASAPSDSAHSGQAAPTPRPPRASTPPRVQVAASPAKQPPSSPSRVLLGLDRGLRAKDVSLKRAPSLRYPPIAGVASTSAQTAATADPFASRPITSPSSAAPVKTFNQRIAEARLADTDKAARLAAVEKSRGKGWGVSEEELRKAREEQEASGARLSSLECLAPKVSIWASSASAPANPVTTTTSRPGTTQSTTTAATDPRAPAPASTATGPPAGAGFDSFSQLHLLTRHLPHPTLSRALSQKTIFLLPDLLKSVTSATDFSPPDITGDWVVMGIIASKSPPRQTSSSSTNTKSADPGGGGGGKYMVLTLTDLKWDLELFLFGSGFTKFWKLSVGGVVAILNPGIMKPRVKDSGRFSLVLGSEEETVLEIGQARDLGWCKAVKRDAARCGMWIDKRRTEVCAWHVEMAVKKTQNQRMELSNTGKLFSPPRKGALRSRQPWLSRGGGGTKARDDGLLPYSDGGGLPDLPQRLGGAGGKVFILPSTNNTNALFDDSFQDAFHSGTREERLKRQLDRSQRERDIAKRLVEKQRTLGGQGGLSSGAEYLRKMVGGLELRPGGAGGSAGAQCASAAGTNNSARDDHHHDYSSLLKGNRANLASAVKLSPLKRRRHLSPAPPPPPPPPPAGADPARRSKKPKTVHFHRPVVTGGADAEDDLEIC
ncbi:hypothetical protein EV426DRAFT_719192 [Tirmania nivea]|nr:hypothetical protein EV426DRAFT_719192 [Tirmania nivea]